MIVTGIRAASRACRVLAAGLALAVAATSASAATIIELKANYRISIAGLSIGNARAEARFSSDRQYATAISGSTYGLARFVSDARADLSGAGRIRGTRVVPSTYNLDTSERGFNTRVRMSMQGNAITDLLAMPGLVKAADRVTVKSAHKRGIVDPVGAFVVPLGDAGIVDGEKVCDRTVSVFDGWQRFDVRLFYRETKSIDDRGGFRGEVTVCGARYVPVAGHRPSRDTVKYMADNTRLEIWLAPIEGANVLVPYRVLIGTAVGDLVIRARSFAVSTSGPEQASVR